MDKAEYQVKLGQLTELVEEQDYEEALKIVEAIDWKRVKSVRTLSMVADVYEANDMLEDSRQILLLAYKRAPIGKNILTRLIDIDLRLRDSAAAADHYREYAKVAGNDATKYLLKYKIYRAQNAPIEKQIEALRSYKDYEYTERWAFELARLYSKAGMQEECVEECDDIILWFSEGIYVIRAMELKMKYTELTPSQKRKYDQRYETTPELLEQEVARKKKKAARAQAKKEAARKAVPEENEAEGSNTLETAGEETAPEPKEASGQDNLFSGSVNLQERLSQSLRKVIGGIARDETFADEEAGDEAQAMQELRDYQEVRELEPEKLDFVGSGVSREATVAMPKAAREEEPAAQEEFPEFDFSAILEQQVDQFLKEDAREGIKEAAATEEIRTEEPAEEPEETEEPADGLDFSRLFEQMADSYAKEESAEYGQEQETSEAAGRVNREPETEEPAVQIWEEPVEEPEAQTWEEPVEEPEAQTWEETAEPAEEPEAQTWEETAEEPEAQTREEPAGEPETQTWEETAEPVDEPEEQTWEEPAEEPEAQTREEAAGEPEKLIQEETAETGEEPGNEPEKPILEKPIEKALEKPVQVETAAEAVLDKFEEPEDLSASLDALIKEMSEKIKESDKPDLEKEIDLSFLFDDSDKEKDKAAAEKRILSEISPMQEASLNAKETRTQEPEAAGFEETKQSDGETDTEEEIQATPAPEEPAREIPVQQEPAEAKAPERRKPSSPVPAERKMPEVHAPKAPDRKPQQQPAANVPAAEKEPDFSAVLSSEVAMMVKEKAAETPVKENKDLLTRLEEEAARTIEHQELKKETPQEKRYRIMHADRQERLTEEQKRLFTYFAKVPGMDEQILDAIQASYNSAVNKTSRRGNIAIMGRKGTGKTRLSEGLVKALCREFGMSAAKVARIQGDDLNDKDVARVVSKMAGGFLIIEQAGRMNRETVEKLSQSMEFRTDSMILLIEDEKDDMRQLLGTYPELANKIDSLISIPVFTNDELVTFARTYAGENGYKMDELAVLALYTIIGNNQSETEPISIAQVKQIMDGAMKKASRGGRKMTRRVSTSDGGKRIMLYEKDFDRK